MAPEVANCDSKRPYNVYPADIYSLGVCLHLLLFGTYPIADSDSEMSTDEENDGSPKYKLDSSPRLDSSSCLIAAYLSEDCLDLLDIMLSQDPSMRPTIKEIENHPWMSQEFPEQIGEIIYSELSERCNHIKSLVADSSPSLSIDLN